MRSSGKVSIIIPNHLRDLTEMLACIRCSLYENYEIIVVDEGKERSAQRNIGIDRATGEYLLFLDSDMYIDPFLLHNCLKKITNCNGVYLREEIITPGLFGKIRNWERQFYTGTPIDVVRFIRRKDCPYFDELQNGTEDSDWDRLIPKPKLISEDKYYHYEDINFITYFKKKAYYANSLKRFSERNPNDKILNWKWRCFGVFLENGKRKKFFSRPFMALAVMFIIFLRGIIFIWKKHLS